MTGGRKCRATISDFCTRGAPPGEGSHFVRVFKQFEGKIKEKQLRPGINWVQLYYGQIDRKPLTYSVLLNNNVWDEVQSEVTAFDWPLGDEFYSVRLFLILDVAPGGTVGPETAVAWLADFVAPRREFTQDDVHAALVRAGVSAALADRAYNFTQTAWGRAFLANVGAQFSPDYVGFNAAGEVVESARLIDDPCFAAATRLVPKYSGAPGFAWLALMSADVNVVNNALNKGSRPEDLVVAQALIFLEPPTAAGMQNAQKTINAPPRHENR